ncbi:MAG: hypothetical protein U5K54_24915 [Cytophagales bacterium]|nr:hypothetical protein [Cytophagales bacterium]
MRAQPRSVLTSSVGAGNQWYKDGASILGATATTLNIATAPGNSGSYTRDLNGEWLFFGEYRQLSL